MKQVYAVFDVKAAAFGMPMFMETEGVAVRGFMDACGNPKGPLSQHPEDYSLFRIGTYDPNSAELVSVKPVPICTAAAMKQALEVEREKSEPLLPKFSSVDEMNKELKGVA